MGVMVMSHYEVEVFENRFAENGTGNVLIVSYTKGQDDPNYNPKPIGVRVFENDHGRAGYNPVFTGGAQLKAAFGGAIPPIIEDGTGENILIGDDVAVLTLGLTKPGQSLAEARPALVAGASEPFDGRQLKPITLPQAMEDAIK